MEPTPHSSFKPSTIILAIIFAVLLALSILAGVTVWTIEHYMNITPADWPYPGSFWDVANDFSCGFIMLPSSSTGRFCAWLILFPVPVLIEARRHNWQKAILFLMCIILPYSYMDAVFDNVLSSGVLADVLVLVLALFAPPYLIQSWSSMTSDRREKFLIRANLIVLWAGFVAADIMLGLSMHHDDCKMTITHALMQ